MKKWIILLERADIGGEVRRPEERAILVEHEHADQLIEQGKAADAAEPIPGGEDLLDKTVEELRETADAEQVDLKGTKRKGDIVEAIVELRQEPAPDAAI